MQNCLIKICGLTSSKQAKSAAQHGANFIGIVFHPQSKRLVSIENAKEIVATAKKAGITPVGVFTEHSAEQIQNICGECDIEVVQLHGNLARTAEQDLPSNLKRIYVINVKKDGQLLNTLPSHHTLNPNRDFLLYDGENPGSGEIFATDIFEPIKNFPFFIAGGLTENNVKTLMQLTNANGVDVSSGVEINGKKSPELIQHFIKNVRNKGRYGEFGGQYIPEGLIAPIQEIEHFFSQSIKDPKFIQEFQQLLKQYAGRVTPLTEVARFSAAIDGPRVFLKREDLLHTGAHKINNALGQCLLAKKMGKTRIIAETGAGQHGVATATACARLGLKCVVYMGEVDMSRQSSNVQRMQLLGAEVIAVTHGQKTLKDAVNEALRDFALNYEDSHYCLGSALGPHPYPAMVAYFHSVIGEEAREQIQAQTGRLPDAIIACVGGGSNAIGIFNAFLNDPVKLIGVEAGGHGDEVGQHAARFKAARKGILHGCYSYLLQDENGQVAKTSSISAGLDYPSVGPHHAQLFLEKRVTYDSVKDDAVIAAFELLAKTEGIIPAFESAHAVAYLIQNAEKFNRDDIVIINLSGRGDKDLATYGAYHGK